MKTLDRDWLTKTQAADYLGVTVQTISSYIRLGYLAATKTTNGMQGRVRISAASIEKMLDGNRIKPSAQ